MRHQNRSSPAAPGGALHYMASENPDLRNVLALAQSFIIMIHYYVLSRGFVLFDMCAYLPHGTALCFALPIPRVTSSDLESVLAYKQSRMNMFTGLPKIIPTDLGWNARTSYLHANHKIVSFSTSWTGSRVVFVNVGPALDPCLPMCGHGLPIWASWAGVGAKFVNVGSVFYIVGTVFAVARSHLGRCSVADFG